MPGPLVALLLAVGAPAALGAQHADATARDSLVPVLAVGARVRVSAPRAGADRVRGRVAGVVADSLVVARRGGDTLRTALRDLVAVDRSLGVDRKAGARRGALVGALIVGVPGTAFAAGLLVHDLAADRQRECGEWCYFGPALVGVATVAGSATAAVAGALIGAAVGRERWEPLRLPLRTGAGPTLRPVLGAGRAGLALRF